VYHWTLYNLKIAMFGRELHLLWNLQRGEAARSSLQPPFPREKLTLIIDKTTTMSAELSDTSGR
jgi:hypothetical protein